MSMISSQCDELRDRAMRVEVFLEGSTDAIPTDTHEQLRDAADTILELRDDLQLANEAARDAEHDESMAWDRVRKVEVENAKLRELVRDVYALNWNGFDCTECPWFDECRTEGGCPWLEILHDHMRELGVKAR